MNTALLHCVRSTAWAFTAVLASNSSLGAEAVAPWLTLEQQHSYPRLAWRNVPGRTYSIQSRERVAGSDWPSVVTLTTDAKAGTWTPLGAGQRLPGGWQLTNVTVDAGAGIRARGFIANSGIGEGIVETTLHAVPVIITSDGTFGVVSNEFCFSVAGVYGQTVVIERSADLRQWFPIRTNSVGNSRLYFSDPDWWQAPHRFYRARLWP